MLMAPCVTYGAAPAWAAIRCRKGRPCSTRAKDDMHPRPAPLRGTWLPRPPDDARSALPIPAPACALRGNAALAPHAPSMPHDHAAGRHSMAGYARAPAVKAIQHNSATELHRKYLCGLRPPLQGERGVDTTAKPLKSFSVPPPFREGQSARPLSVGCFSQSADGATVD